MGFAFGDSIHAQAAAGAGGREGGREGKAAQACSQLQELGMLLPPRPCGEWESWAEGRERTEKERWSLF